MAEQVTDAVNTAAKKATATEKKAEKKTEKAEKVEKAEKAEKAEKPEKVTTHSPPTHATCCRAWPRPSLAPLAPSFPLLTCP